ncbi:MAG TPA: DUF72 domain-containing protein [Sphingobacteriaceae bacterium]
MDFGKLPGDTLSAVDFTLPSDPPLTRQVLGTAGARANLPIYVGCAKWGRKEWVGLIYPPKTPETRFFDEYVKHFNSIELNAVFYQMPKAHHVHEWTERAEQRGGDFRFFPKVTRSISHIRRLKNAEEATTMYLERIAGFGRFLGPCFLQMPENFGPKNLETLSAYLASLPKDFDLFVEVRHPDWFSDPAARKELFGMLKDAGRGAVITDAAGRRDCVHMELPTPYAFIRFVGNGLHPSDYSRIDAWTERLRSWHEQGLQGIYFFLHQHDEKDTPVLADYTVGRFNEALPVRLPRITFLNKN